MKYVLSLYSVDMEDGDLAGKISTKVLCVRISKGIFPLGTRQVWNRASTLRLRCADPWLRDNLDMSTPDRNSLPLWP